MSRNTQRFPRAGWPRRGYRRKQVDGFVEAAERSLGEGGARALTAADIRRVGFDLVRRGYDVAAVDGWLDLLEQRALNASYGSTPHDDTLVRDSTQLAEELTAEPRRHFRRVPLVSRGYHPRAVDAFLDRLVPVLAGEAHGIDANAVRQVVFRAKRGGYEEAAVDDALDAAVEVFLRRDRAARQVPQAHPQDHSDRTGHAQGYQPDYPAGGHPQTQPPSYA